MDERMSWMESIFGSLLRAARNATRSKQPHELPGAILLEPVRERLALTASMLAEKKLDIREAESIGGCSGSVLWLPKAMRISEVPEVNAEAFLYRCVFSAMVSLQGLTLAAHHSNERHRGVIAMALCAGKIEDDMLTQFPSMVELRTKLIPHVIANRNFADITDESEYALEWLIRQRLARTKDTPDRQLHNVVRAWLDQALALEFDAVIEMERVRSLTEQWCRLSSRKSLEAVQDRAVILWGTLMAASGQNEGTEATSGDFGKEALSRGKEHRGKPREHWQEVKLSQEELQDNPLVHSFEKIKTAEEYKGGQKSLDGADEMAEHAEALDELDLREVIRSRERTESLLRTDAMFEGTAGDLSDEGDHTPGIPYDEWYDKTGSYRKDWCTVKVGVPQPRSTPQRTGQWITSMLVKHHSGIESLRGEFLRVVGERAWHPRQTEGSELDVDAIVDLHATLAARKTPPDRLWMARRRSAPGLAVLVLLDVSLSSDGWVSNQRVLEIERESAMILGTALDGIHDEFGMAAFYSNTRRDCRFLVVKGMNEPWHTSRSRLAYLEPTGYTRIGPALRHATTVLQRTKARRKVLFVLTDGRPTDFDRYEGRYGIADVRQAVREAEVVGVHPYALTTDAQAKIHLPTMFGAGRYEILPRAEDLPRAAGKIVAQLLI